ncbi:MAG: hypothetical protein KYX66_11960 [Blastomonas fulva]|uniref:hypothetical protein n=1 Tax=Blastomonas fulva TaxID=1550728 RepID=UPI0024E21752|nr:hypothetical protein [Blastomonas fulva]MDK2757444.1 hypothetical protein [Blastomonas fulva]
MIGIIPENDGDFGDVETANDIFFENEINPLQQRMPQLNEWLGVEALVFGPHQDQAYEPNALAYAISTYRVSVRARGVISGVD